MSNRNQNNSSGYSKGNKNYNRNKKKRYYNNKNSNNNNNESKVMTPRVKPKQYSNNKNRPETFTELNYTDKVVFLLGFVTVLMSIAMWFMGYREEATYIGIWVPGIFSAGIFIRMSFSRAKRK
jgi:hypothetical protein